MPATPTRQSRPPPERAPIEAAAPPLALAEVRSALAHARPACTVYACSRSKHVLQIYAGLYALHQAGHIRLKQRFGPDALRQRLAPGPIDEGVLSTGANGLLVDVERAGLVFFDVRDGANFYRHTAERALIYAKRSFRRSAYPSRPEKFVPLGLNYAVCLDRTTLPELTRVLAQLELSRAAGTQLAFALARLFPALGAAIGVPTVGSLTRAVDRGIAPRAIFLARAWAPGEASEPPEVLRALNDLRAGCVRELRKRFGRHFLGGLAPSPYVLEHYPDCIVEPGVSTRRNRYLQCLRSYCICVATTGLHESIGWKLGEYVALSKAIVSEPLRFELPGRFAEGENYLEFRTVAACAERVGELFDRPALRLAMMESNSRYHREYGTPEAMVGRVLHSALRAGASTLTR